MQLCRHLRPLYRRAIKDGNGILRIGTGCGCGWQLCVHFTDPPQRPLRSFRRRTDVQTHPAYPHVVSVYCTKLESLVIADQNAAVNTFPGLVHTARHTMGVSNARSQ